MSIRLAGTFKKLESRDDQDWKGDIKITCKNANVCKVAFCVVGIMNIIAIPVVLYGSKRATAKDI